MKLLLSQDMEFSHIANGKDTKGRSIFHHCVLRNDLELLQRLQSFYSADSDSDLEGANILMRACQHQQVRYYINWTLENRLISTIYLLVNLNPKY